MGINFKIILKVISAVSFLTAAGMLVPIMIALLHNEHATPFILVSLCTMALAGLVFFQTRKVDSRIAKREGYLIVVFSWISIALISSIPYFLQVEDLSYASALFESFSGLTTTGATIFNDLENLQKSTLIWRSITQWIGGMGIIVLTVAIFPLLGIGGVELFVAESPGPTSNKIHPRIKETAKRLWLIYVSLTTLLIFILRMEGMNWFESINHGLTTMATGGFSTKNNSIAYFDNPLIQYTLIIFMFIAGINYTLLYLGLKGKFHKFWQSDEFKTYLGFILFSIAFVTTIILIHTDHGVEKAFREASFQVISLITTTGYVSADYTAWSPTATLFFFGLLFCGACAGSTSGGIKFIRHMVFAKNTLLEFKRLLHPNALIRIRLDNEIVRPRILTHILVFLLLYLFTFLIGTVVMSFLLSDFQYPILSAAGAAATTLGNVGPAIGNLGPLDNFSEVPDSGKLFLSFLMLVGRLELFSVLIILTPSFWRSV